MKKTMLTALAFAATALYAETYTVSGDETVSNVAAFNAYTSADEINIPAGSSLEIIDATTKLILKAKLSGAGAFKATSAKEVELWAASPNFSGDVVFSNTPLTLKNCGALGSGAVTFASSVTNVLTIADSGEVPNNITFNGLWAYDHGANCSVTNTGIVTFNCTQRSYIGKNATEVAGGFTFVNQFNRGGSSDLYCYRTVTLAPTVMLSGFTLNAGYQFFVNSYANLRLDVDLSVAAPGQFLSGYYLYVTKGTATCLRENVFTGGYLRMGSTTSPYGTFDLNGFNQTFACVFCEYPNSGKEQSVPATIVSATPATFTITQKLARENKGTHAFDGNFDGAVNLRCDVGADGYCVITNSIGKKGKIFESTTTGSLIASSGTLELDGARFPNVSRLVLTNSGSIVVSAFSAQHLNPAVTVERAFGATGTLDIPTGTTLLAAYCVTNNAEGKMKYLLPATYTAADLPEVISGGGSLQVTEMPPSGDVEEFTWTGAAEPDLSVTTAGNWAGNTAPALQLGNELLKFPVVGEAVFPAGTSYASGLVFTGLDFALSSVSEGSVALGGDGISCAAGSYSLSLPVAFLGSDAQTVSLADGASLAVTGNLSSVTSPLDFTTPGSAAVTLAGDNSAFAAEMRFPGEIAVTAATQNALGTKAVFTDSLPVFAPDLHTNAAELVITNFQGTASPVYSRAFVPTSEVPFVQEGAVAIFGTGTEGNDAYRPQFNFYGPVEFKGGFREAANYSRFHFILRNAAAQVRFSENPYAVTREVRLDCTDTACTGRFIFAVAGNAASAFRVLNAIVQTDVDDVFAGQCLYLGLTSGQRTNLATVDLNGHDQHVGWVGTDGKHTHADYYVTITSTNGPATLTANGVGVKTVPSKAHATGYGTPFKFEGEVSFALETATSVLLTNHVSTTTGSLTVRRGVVGFYSGAGWGGGTDVTVGGFGPGTNAIIRVAESAAATAFAKAGGAGSIVKLAVEERGSLDLEGGVVKVDSLYLPDGEHTAAENRTAGKCEKSGTYAALDYPGEAIKVSWITGAGRLRVARKGFTLVLK